MQTDGVVAGLKAAQTDRMSAAPPYDARGVANFLLDLADSRKIRLTQVSLLKLLYFSHGWYLATYEEPLLAQDFEAWQYGPVLKVVRDSFRKFGAAPITTRASRLVLKTGVQEYVTPALGSSDALFVTSIFDAYHVFDAWQLSDMTHEPNSPWDALWNSSAPVGRLALRLRNEDIRAHFVALRSRIPVS